MWDILCLFSKASLQSASGERKLSLQWRLSTWRSQSGCKRPASLSWARGRLAWPSPPGRHAVHTQTCTQLVPHGHTHASTPTPQIKPYTCRHERARARTHKHTHTHTTRAPSVASPLVLCCSYSPSHLPLLESSRRLS